MTYVTDQTSAELRVHMRSLKRMQGWHEPLADRLFKEVVEQDATIKRLEGALAAAEARNATLTDDAARAKWIEQNLTYADFRNGEYINVALWSTDDRAAEIRNAIDTMARGEDR